MKNKIPIYIFIVVLSIGLFSPLLRVRAVDCTAQNTPAGCTPAATTSDGKYTLLEPLPCEENTPNCEKNLETGKYELSSFDPGGQNKLGIYLNFAINLFIGLCAVAAVVMIVIGGIEYSTTELISTKAAAKDRIQGAILGLLLALGSYAILFTINPDLLNTEVDISAVTLISEGEQGIEDLHFTPAQAQSIINGANVGNVNGYGVVDGVVNKIAPIIEKGSQNTISCIVLHQTDGNNGSSALATWIHNGGATGAHFIIFQDGTIWQTARVGQKTNSIKNVVGGNYSNSNTVNIEVVGDCYIDRVGSTRCDSSPRLADRRLRRTVWDPPTGAQRASINSLINTLQSYNVPNCVVGHGEISSNKTYNEGTGLR